MEMLTNILILLCGLALVVTGADILVDGASAVARRFGLSEFVIGLTIVGMGTSAPEMVVSFIGAVEGNADVSIGNVVGSNIFNTLLILGVTALLMPVGITPDNRKKDIPINIGVTALLIGLGLFGGLSAWDGGILLAVFFLYMWQSFRQKGAESDPAGEQTREKKLWLSALMILGGIAALIWGGTLFVDNATALARGLGVSDKFIAVTLLAGGTSLPELATCVAAAVKKKGQLALGNIIGSNLFNILLILGVTALLMPVGITPDNRKKDIPINIGVTALLIGLGLFGGLSAWDGGLLLAVFVLYMWQSFSQKAPTDPAAGQTAEKKLWLSVGMIIAGIAALIWGGTLFVDNATALARGLGVSDKFIAVTLLAGGTSLPELATCVAAAVKKKGQLALGNIIGSNLFNILLILGGSALIHPLSFQDITFVDLGILLASSVALLSACFIGRKNTVDRLDGALFVLLFAAYFTYLFIKL